MDDPEEQHSESPASSPGGARPGDDLSDDELVGRIVAGDADSLRVLMRRYDRLVRYAIYKTARDRCRRDPDWLDARASETWTGFVGSMRRTGARPPRDLATYLLQTTRNKCLDALRIGGALAERTVEGEGVDLSQLASPQKDTAEFVEQLEEAERLRSCIAMLSAEERALCAEYELIVERRWTQAAERLGIAESTLRSRWPGVLDRLRDCLEQKMKKNPRNLAPPGLGSDS